MRTDRLALRYALAAAVMWSTVASAFKLSLRHLDVFQLLFYANLVACLCLGVIVASRGTLPRLRQPPAALARTLLLGLLNPLAYYLILLRAYDLLPAQVALAINYSWAIMLMLLSVPLLGHRINRFDGCGALLCYGGVVIVCLAGHALPEDLSGTGVALAVGSTVLWALYWIAKTRDPMDPVVSLFLSFLFALPATFAVCIAASTVYPVPAAGLLGAAWVGVFEMGLTFVVWLLALRHAGAAAKVTNVIFLSPVLSLLAIRVFVGEPILATTIIGLGLIIAGLLVQQHGGRPSAAANPA
jgi:drug/metabolite transporter (DMT)-like permease